LEGNDRSASRRGSFIPRVTAQYAINQKQGRPQNLYGRYL